MTTATVPRIAELQRALEELLGVAAQYAGLEDRLQRKAAELEAVEWQFAEDRPPSFAAAIEAEVGKALAAAKGESGSELDALDICQQIQDALDVLTFAMERDDRAR
jgi:hypothetical protein